MGDRFEPVDQKTFLAAVSKLLQLPRIVYLLHCHDGLSYSEIGLRIGEGEQEVEIYLAQALEALINVIDRPTLQ